MNKEKLFSITASDCRWDYYKGTGAGGQKRNKTENCVRCTHIASGAVGKSEDGRSKDLNKRTAFERMAKTDVFQKWLKAEISRRTGELAIIEEKIDRSMVCDTVVEVREENGKWQKAEELQISQFDIDNIKE